MITLEINQIKLRLKSLGHASFILLMQTNFKLGIEKEKSA